MTSKILAAGSATLIGAASLLAAAPAHAITVADCGTVPDGAFVNLINGEVCTVLFNYNSETNWTAPNNVERIAAVLVGGGGGSVSFVGAGYGGGGGEVLYIDDVDPDDVVDIAVGEGGTFANGGDGEQTSFGPYTALGGEHGDWSLGGDLGDSGSGNSGAPNGGNIDNGLYGGGAKTAATSSASGEGYLLSDPDLTDNDPLFPVQETAIPWGQGGSIVDTMPEQTGYGEGGSASSSTSMEGTQGAIIFRWAAVASDDSDALADTGVDANGIGITAGVLGLSGVALGVFAAVRRSRRIQ